MVGLGKIHSHRIRPLRLFDKLYKHLRRALYQLGQHPPAESTYTYINGRFFGGLSFFLSFFLLGGGGGLFSVFPAYFKKGNVKKKIM